MKKLILLTAILIAQQFFAQKHCSSPKEEIHDPNSISIKKCGNENNKIKKAESSKIFLTRTRYLNRRKNSKRVGFVPDIVSEKEKSRTKIELSKIKKNISSVVNSKVIEEEVVVTFNEVDVLPSFASCKESDLDGESCFNNEIQQHINKNFNYPEEALDNDIEGVVLVSFVINTDGNITDLKTITPQNAEILKEEAIRIVSLLPKFIPGKHNNQDVSVAYSFPMKFEIH